MFHSASVMNLSYISLCVTSLLGALLFFGFTFRIRIKYPLRIVSAHVIMASVTAVLLCAAVIQALFFRSAPSGGGVRAAASPLIAAHAPHAHASPLTSTHATHAYASPLTAAHATHVYASLWTDALLVAGVLLMLLTYGLGLYFYLRYDARRRHLKLHSVVLHLSLAGLSFIFITSAFAVSAWTVSPHATRQATAAQSPVWFIVHRHRALRHAYERQLGQTSGIAP